MKAVFTHDISIEYPVTEAILLFTPRGEESWVPDWEPHYIDPTHGDTCEEMIFTTRHDGEMTYWTCMKWGPEVGHARYFRLTPESRAAFVDVQCRAVETDRTSVSVTCESHALTDAGRAKLAEMNQNAFDEMIEEWAQLIRAMPERAR